MIDKSILTNDIETLREKLNQYLLYLNPTDTKVVNASQELDKLIVIYQRFLLFTSNPI